MKNLPKSIFVVTCNHSLIHGHTPYILDEYLAGLPHIMHSNYSEWDNSSIYILSNIAGFRNILNKFQCCTGIGGVLGFATYNCISSGALIMYEICASTNWASLPTTIVIATKDIDNLIALTSGYSKHG